MEESTYLILAYYFFAEVESPEIEVERHQTFFEGRDATARIYLSKEGINGQLCASKSDALAYIEWLRSDPRFKEVDFKVHSYHEHVLPKLTIKTREQLVALDHPVDLSRRGEYVSPHEWRQMLESRQENVLLIDVRNDYESKVGHFEGAILPSIENFREFPQYAEQLAQEYDPEKTKVMMYCTGGIRCELYSSLLKEKGFQTIYQLHGGVIKYGLEEGNAHWKGKLFVFDDRLVVPIDQGETELISECIYCQKSCDAYINCANMDCNALFICCKECSEKNRGCCSSHCLEGGRVRPITPSERPKPFRKLPFEQKKQL